MNFKYSCFFEMYCTRNKKKEKKNCIKKWSNFITFSIQKGTFPKNVKKGLKSAFKWGRNYMKIKKFQFSIPFYTKLREITFIMISQCGNFMIFTQIFYVKSILWIIKVQNLPFLPIKALNFDFYVFLHFLKAEIYQINNIESPKIAKTAVLDSPKLISRKI